MNAKSGSWLSRRLSNWLLKDSPPTRAFLSDFDRILNEIRPCDVVLVEGRNRASRLISILTNSAWTHSALYIGCAKDYDNTSIRSLIDKHYHGPVTTPLLVEALPGRGTVISALPDYEFDHIRICRPTGLRGEDATLIITHVLQQVGLEYNLRQLLDLTLFLLPWKILPKTFLKHLFGPKAGATAEAICSTTIANAFDAVDFPILPMPALDANKRLVLIKRNARLYTPSDFDYSPFFAIIKYPIFTFSKYSIESAYLPWENDKTSQE